MSPKLRPFDCQLLARVIKNPLLPDTWVKISVIQSMVKDEFGSKISYPKAWYSKQLVLQSLFGTHKEAFENLIRLLSSISVYIRRTIYDCFFPKRVNAVTHLATFGVMGWSFSPAIEGIVDCRPLINTDGTHLYGKYSRESPYSCIV